MLFRSSTGIGAANPFGCALVAGFWAMEDIAGEASFFAVPSPLQCSARDYGSCFSRAVEMATPDLRRLMISGTASISPEGLTEHVGDVRKQGARTFEVVNAILESRRMKWTDVSRATAYLKRATDGWALAEYLLDHDLHLPLIVTEADVCRDDLLFEMELDAMAPATRGSNEAWEI